MRYGAELARGIELETFEKYGMTPAEILAARPSNTTRTHGHTTGGKVSSTYHSWMSMKRRCIDPNHVAYERYGGRGIEVCERWMTFANFLEDMGEKPSDPEGWASLRAYWTLDRIDVNGNYEPGNCRWATPTEQAGNKRCTCGQEDKLFLWLLLVAARRAREQT